MLRLRRRLPLITLPVALLLTVEWSLVSVECVAIPLECRRHYNHDPHPPPSDEGGDKDQNYHNNDENNANNNNNNDPASSFIVCQFKVMEEATETASPTEKKQHYTLDPLCWEYANHENGSFSQRKKICLGGTLQVTTTMVAAINDNDDIFPLSSTESDGGYVVEDVDTDQSFSSASESKQRTIAVGRATYHPPYSQHGSRVEGILDQAPPSNDEHGHDLAYRSQQEWIDWYIQLAAAHYPTIGQDPSNDEVWVQIELAINAYEQAIQAIKRLEQQATDTSSPISFENQVLLAATYYHLGESYSLDPELRYVDQTLQALRSSYAQFREILRHPSLHPSERSAVESKFAEACSKLGIALLSSLDPLDTIPAWARSTMMMMDPENAKILDNAHYQHQNNNQQQEQHQQQQYQEEYSESTTALDRVQGYFHEAIQIFERHFQYEPGGEFSTSAVGGDSGDGDGDSGGSNILKNRLITPQELKFQYALTLQQSAVVSSIQGHFLEAKHGYEQALKILLLLQLGVHTGGGYYQQDVEYTQTSIADLHLSLSDTCLQLGNYGCAKEQYAQAMATHTQHKVRVAPMMPMVRDAEIDAAIQEALEALQDYRAGVGEGGGANKYRQREGLETQPYDSQGGRYFYSKDDGYEGDLLASLGTLYLSLGDPRAVPFLEQARDLYTVSQQDRESSAMADLMINLAMAYYRNYEFEKSEEAHWQASDIYQKQFGDGVNPYGQGLINFDGQDGEESTKMDGRQPEKIIDVESYQASVKSQNATKRKVTEEL